METMDSPFSAPPRPKFDSPRNEKRRDIWLLSLLFHLILFAVLAGMEKERLIPAPITAPPISATLVFPTRIASENTPSQQSPPNEESRPPNAKPLFTDAPSTAQSLSASDVEQQTASQPTPENDKPVIPSQLTPEVRPTAPDATQTRGMTGALTSRQALDHFFNQQRAAALQREARVAASEHRRITLSPDIVDPRKGDPEEEMSAPPAVEVDCSGTATHVLATIANYTGGRVTCSDRSKGFDKFIDARVNKRQKDDR